MNDFTSLSTTIDTGNAPTTPGGGDAPVIERDVEKPSVRDAIATEFKNEERRQADAGKKVDKPSEVKPEAKTDAKPVENVTEKPAEEKSDAKPADEAKPTEAVQAKPETDDADAKREQQEKAERRHVEAPTKFMPRAKELWRNTPREVQQEVERLTKEHDEEVGRYRTHTERYESIRELDELAKSNGRELRDSLTKLHAIENTLQRNPIAGLNSILMEIGPRKADGQPVSLYELATHIVQQGPQGYQQVVAQAREQEQAQQPNQQVEALQKQLEQLQQQTIQASVIKPFADANPRYYELQGHIAQLLNSGMIPDTLSREDRLATAYDMAVRLNPASRDDTGQTAQDNDRVAISSDQDRRADDDFSGSKSIKSAPGAVSDQDAEEEAKGGESIRDSIRAVSRRLNRA